MSVSNNEAVPNNFWDVVTSVITFPWYLLKLVVNFFLGRWIGKRILRSQSELLEIKTDKNNHLMTFEITTREEGEYCVVRMENTFTLTEMTVMTRDNIALSTITITPTSLENPPIYIIHFPDDEDCYQVKCKNMIEEAIDSRACVIGFNYRGVFKLSEPPTCHEDLVADGIAQVHRLLDEGVKPERIFLKGEAFGAAIATLVTAHFHREQKKINLWNGRGFSTLTNLFIGRIRQFGANSKTGYTETTSGIILGYLLMPFIKLSLNLSGWDIQADKAFKTIPEVNKRYYLIRSPKSTRKNLKEVDDPQIPHYASLHQSIDKAERQKTRLAQKFNGHHETVTSTAATLKNRNGYTLREMFGFFIKPDQRNDATKHQHLEDSTAHRL